MFEHFRTWFKNPRIFNAIGLILAVIGFIVVLKHFNLYEGFSDLKEPKLLETYQQQPNKLEHFSDNSIKITHM